MKYNIDKLRVLTKSFDILDIVFFNKIKALHIGLEGGLTGYPTSMDPKRDTYLQLKLRTRALAYGMPDSLMRCRGCKTMILEEFNLANDELFFDEFNFIMKSSKEGSLINVLKKVNLSELKHEQDFINILSKEVKNEDSQTKEDLYFLCSNIAVDHKKDLLLDEEDIVDKNKLFGIILKDKNTIETFKKLCKNIKENYDKMKIHIYYQEELLTALGKIEKEIGSILNRKDKLYERICKNFEKGYGNPEIKQHINSLPAKSIFVSLVNEIDKLPKSENLFGKLSSDKKAKLLPIKEFEVKDLINDGIVVKVLDSISDVDI